MTARIEPAFQIAKALHGVHSNGRLHKGFRSEHILFFPTHKGASRTLEIHDLQDSTLFGRRDLMSTRRNQGMAVMSSVYALSMLILRCDRNTFNNVHRHPDALRDPRTNFTKAHDYYSLDIVFIEIAVWRPVWEILQKAQELQGETCREEDARNIRDILLIEYSEDNHLRDIAYRMGDRFLSIIRACLRGEWNISGDQSASVMDTFQRKVVDELGRFVI